MLSGRIATLNDDVSVNTNNTFTLLDITGKGIVKEINIWIDKVLKYNNDLIFKITIDNNECSIDNVEFIKPFSNGVRQLDLKLPFTESLKIEITINNNSYISKISAYCTYCMEV